MRLALSCAPLLKVTGVPPGSGLITMNGKKRGLMIPPRVISPRSSASAQAEAKLEIQSQGELHLPVRT